MVFEIFTTLVPLAALPLRLAVGTAFVVHGYPKLSGESAKQTRDFMKTIGVPPSVTSLTALLEFFGGIAIILGFLTPIAGLLIALQMLGTTILSKNKLQKKYVLGYELDIAYLAGALSLMFLGAGPFSLDAILGL